MHSLVSGIFFDGIFCECFSVRLILRFNTFISFSATLSSPRTKSSPPGTLIVTEFYKIQNTKSNNGEIDVLVSSVYKFQCKRTETQHNYTNFTSFCLLFLLIIQ
jgi:hypothetical protein